MSNIQNINSAPEYISDFLNQNMVKLKEIYENSKKEMGEGCLGFKCSQKDNKMDVFYMDEVKMIEQINKESWEQLKSTIGDKMLYLILSLIHISEPTRPY